MLTLTSCYLMWMVTYMAQLHPPINNVISFNEGRREFLMDSTRTVYFQYLLESTLMDT
ncbi:uncharacterized protein BJ212DRAFT_1390070 [Suillus subaureus]|uniref:Uncharacterized protein n=1 Tax=Suillus subaureus TaxID=48587 RepID=A0A9P7DNB7_9AGAM|nr:uncharacterized protein BJ212DRAFT_1402410 [Suillus subaureus]XP_041187518.1 uncharacterized protein BJ212DRAFT_1390070 [Suillus subaureus]KAG1799140.1 hypothetical protein BJ212DRAFT_1402410 [Suillus subaureus]KAG1805942.1 hypothetical protein BJ212DRAFT_1390070 [Suillus subaureus]